MISSAFSSSMTATMACCPFITPYGCSVWDKSNFFFFFVTHVEDVELTHLVYEALGQRYHQRIAKSSDQGGCSRWREAQDGIYCYSLPLIILSPPCRLARSSKEFCYVFNADSRCTNVVPTERLYVGLWSRHFFFWKYRATGSFTVTYGYWAKKQSGCGNRTHKSFQRWELIRASTKGRNETQNRQGACFSRTVCGPVILPVVKSKWEISILGCSGISILLVTLSCRLRCSTIPAFSADYIRACREAFSVILADC
jgi:hypothetical protein